MDRSSFVFLWILIVDIVDVFRSYRAEQWPIVPGSIISSNAIKGCGKAGSSYYPVVHYRYAIGESSYNGQRIAFGNVGCGSEEHAISISAMYPLNTVISVHFNPDQPTDAVLVVGDVLEDTWNNILIMCVLIPVTIWLVSGIYRSKVINEP